MNAKLQPPSSFREAAPYLGLGIQLAAAILVFYFIGSWADRKFDTTPWLMVVGVLIGAAGGFIQFFRSVSELGKKEPTNMDDGPT